MWEEKKDDSRQGGFFFPGVLDITFSFQKPRSSCKESERVRDQITFKQREVRVMNSFLALASSASRFDIDSEKRKKKNE